MRRQVGRYIGVIQEGRVKVLDRFTDDSGRLVEAFYNPAQKINRDLSLLAYRTYCTHRRDSEAGGGRYLDAFSATGMRAMRVRKEIDRSLISQIDACDVSRDAIDMMHRNLALNGIDDIGVVHNDAMVHLLQHRKQYDIIDIDPYGSAQKYMPTIMECCKHQAMIGVTYTDLKVLEGPDYRRLYSLYGIERPLSDACKEERTVRYLLYSINREAIKHKKTIVPLLSVWKNFYVRLFFQVVNDSKACNESISHMSTVFRCVDCRFEYCHEYLKDDRRQKVAFDSCISSLPCSHKYQVDGGIWTGPLNDRTFVTQMRDTLQPDADEEVASILNTVINEVDGNLYDLTPVFSSLKCTAASRKLI